MNIENGAIMPLDCLNDNEINSGLWHTIKGRKQECEASHNLEKDTNVNLHTRSALSNAARNKRKKRKKMTAKSRVKNRSKK